jgi:uncharacterized cupin superfamily protein
MCAGFAVGGPAHQLVNRTDLDVVFVEIGDSTRARRPPIPTTTSKR